MIITFIKQKRIRFCCVNAAKHISQYILKTNEDISEISWMSKNDISFGHWAFASQALCFPPCYHRYLFWIKRVNDMFRSICYCPDYVYTLLGTVNMRTIMKIWNILVCLNLVFFYCSLSFILCSKVHDTKQKALISTPTLSTLLF